MNERYIAAIEISSSKIICAVGKTRGDGNLEVLAVEQETDIEGISYGIIKNLEETSLSVSRLINRLEQRATISPRKIKRMIVGVAGRSLHSVISEISIDLPAETEINDEILDRLKEQAMHTVVDSSLEVLDAVPRNYKVGNIETISPKGMLGDSITAVFDLIVCRPELKRNIRRTLTDKLHIDISGYVVTAMSTGYLLLTSDEKRLGCMLVDFGAETTTVTIYKNGSLRYFATLPMGGRNITRDITTLGVLEDRAEEIKRTSGNALPDSKASNLNINGIKLSDINNLVVARSEEIVANVIEQIEYAGLKETDISAGIICIGGASRLQGFTELLTQQSDLPVRMGKMPSYVKVEDNKVQNAELTEVVSVMYAGATLSDEECLEMPGKEELPPTGVLNLPFDEEDEEPEEKKEQKHKEKNRSNFFGELGNKFRNFFGDPDDDSDLI